MISMSRNPSTNVCRLASARDVTALRVHQQRRTFDVLEKRLNRQAQDVVGMLHQHPHVTAAHLRNEPLTKLRVDVGRGCVLLPGLNPSPCTQGQHDLGLAGVAEGELRVGVGGYLAGSSHQGERGDPCGCRAATATPIVPPKDCPQKWTDVISK
jgi:hypothetical protein